MRARVRSAAGLAVLILCLFVAPGASAAPLFGFNDTPQTFASHAFAAQRVGATIARVPVSWELTEPHPGRFDWSTLDEAAAALQAQGIRPLFVLGAAPEWAAPDCVRATTATCAPGEGFEDAYATMGLALLQRYRGSQLQAWNEPNLVQFGAIGARRVAELTNVLYRVAPRKVIGPSASPSGPAYLRYTDRAYRSINRHVPLAVNLYPRSIYRKRQLGDDWARAQEIAGGRAVWVTEIGYSTSEFGAAGQARRTASAYRFLADHGARAIIVHCLQDHPTPQSEWLSSLGLLHADGTPKPAYRALREAISSRRSG